MHAAFLTAEIFVAVVFTITGALKITLPRERLISKMHWAATWPRWRIKLLGLAEVAGAAGLVLPIATGIAPGLTPAAALSLAALMVGAVRTHQRLREPYAAAVIIGVFCVGIAVFRLL